MGRGGFTRRRGLFRTLFTPKVTPAPPIEIRKYNGIVYAFLVALKHRFPDQWLEAEICLIIIKLKRQQDKTTTKK